MRPAEVERWAWPRHYKMIAMSWCAGAKKGWGLREEISGLSGLIKWDGDGLPSLITFEIFEFFLETFGFVSNAIYIYRLKTLQIYIYASSVNDCGMDWFLCLRSVWGFIFCWAALQICDLWPLLKHSRMYWWLLRLSSFMRILWLS